ncbi:MAG: BatD family protein [Pseudomonadota bacterium]
MWKINALARVLLVVVFGVAAASAGAEVFVTLDRSVVQTNESFSLVLTADEGEQGEPDVSALREHFDELGRSQNSSFSIVNGQRQTSRRWTIVLLPKTAGEFEIPALSVGGVSSRPVRVTVKEAVAAPPGEADVFFEVSLDTSSSWVQAEVIYTIKLYLGVAVRSTKLEEPRVDGGEMIVQRLADDRRYDAQIGERLYTVIERNFAMFAQASGDYEIAPARFTASLWERGRISTPRVFQSEPLSLSVQPTVAPPAEFAGSNWLPAKALTLDADVRPDDGILEPGEPANVRLRLAATGLMGNQLPEIALATGNGLRVYPDQPEITERALQTGMQSRREQGFAVIAGAGGVFELPSLRVPWFNTTTGEWQAASVALPTLRAAGVVNSTANQAPAAATDLEQDAAALQPAAGPADVALREELFRLKVICAGLLALWLLTLAWVWRVTNSKRTQRRNHRATVDREAPFRATRRSLKRVQQACQKNDPIAAHENLLEWAQSFWPEANVRTLGDIAMRVDPADADPIRELDRHRYSATDTPWNGAGLAKAVLRLHRPGVQTRTSARSELPPLFPTSS